MHIARELEDFTVQWLQVQSLMAEGLLAVRSACNRNLIKHGLAFAKSCQVISCSLDLDEFLNQQE